MSGFSAEERAARAAEEAAEGLETRFDLWEVRVRPEGEGIVLEGRTTAADALEALRATLRREEIAVEDRIRLLSREGEADRIVLTPVVGLRDRPDPRGGLLTQAILGETVRLLGEEEEGWAPVRAKDGYVGYARTASLAEPREDKRARREPSPHIRVAARRALIQAVPSDSSLPIREAVHGSILLARSRRGEWVGVEMPDGAVGWVREALIEPAAGEERRATPERIVETARLFLGVPYLWGGTSAFGFDCSGLVQRVFGFLGIPLPRDADLQHRAAEPLREGARRREGDLLFFGDGRITHVALSLGGPQFVHASGWVRVQSLHPDSPSYRKDLRALYRGAGRIPGLDR